MKRAMLGLLALTGLAVLAFLAGRVSPAQAFTAPNDNGGHDHVAGVVTEAENCGTYVRGAEGNGYQTDPLTYDWAEPSPLGTSGALAAPDHNWAHDDNGDFIVVDLGHPASVVDLFPSIDHEPVPDEAVEV